MEIGSVSYLIVTTIEAEHRKRVLATTEGNGVGYRATGGGRRGGEGGEEEIAVWRGHRVESTALP